MPLVVLQLNVGYASLVGASLSVLKRLGEPSGCSRHCLKRIHIHWIFHLSFDTACLGYSWLRIIGNICIMCFWPFSYNKTEEKKKHSRITFWNYLWWDDRTLSGECGALSEENRTLPGAYGTHVPSVIKSPQVRGLTLFGWQILKPKRKQKNYSDKELQRSATVLGYAAHVSLCISYFFTNYNNVMSSEQHKYPNPIGIIVPHKGDNYSKNKYKNCTMAY